jgi:2'-5' RNA ligase
MRAFVAAMLDAPAQDACAGLVERCLGRTGPILRPVPPGSAHLTLAFMASLPEIAVDEVAASLREVAVSHDAIAATLGPPAILRSGREARLVHAPVDTGRAAVARLAAHVNAASRRRLPDLEVRDTPAPHVTLARFRRGTRWRDLLDLAAWLDHELGEWHLPVTIDAMHVIESVLTAAGPRYVERAAIVLGSRSS